MFTLCFQMDHQEQGILGVYRLQTRTNPELTYWQMVTIVIPKPSKQTIQTHGGRSPTSTVWTTHTQPWSPKSVTSALYRPPLGDSNAREASLPVLPSVCSLFLDVSLCVGPLCKWQGKQQRGRGEGSYGAWGQQWPEWDRPLVFPKDMWHEMLRWPRKCCLASYSADRAGLGQRPREGRAEPGWQLAQDPGGGRGGALQCGGAVAVGRLLSLLQALGQASPPAISPGIPEETVGTGRQRAQGLSRRRVPGHLSHRKGTRRWVKVAVKVCSSS